MLLNPILKEKLLIDVSCGLYVLFLAPVVKNIVEQSIYGWGNAKGAGILALILLLFNVLEIFAVSPFISQILNEITDKKILFSKETSLILLIVMHAVVTLIAVIFAFQLLGYTFKTRALLLSIFVVSLPSIDFSELSVFSFVSVAFVFCAKALIDNDKINTKSVALIFIILFLFVFIKLV